MRSSMLRDLGLQTDKIDNQTAVKEKIKETVLSKKMLDSGYFNQEYLETLIKDHQSGIRDYSAPLWTLMMFHQFLSKGSIILVKLKCTIPPHSSYVRVSGITNHRPPINADVP